MSALGYNLLTVLSLPFLGYTFAERALRAFRMPAPASVFINSKLIWGQLIGIATFWVLRNIPV